MEEKEVQFVTNTAPSAKILTKAKYHRFGNIFYNMSIACLSLILVALLSTLVMPLLWMFAFLVLFLAAIAIVVFTLGLVLTNPNNPATKIFELIGSLSEASGNMESILEFCLSMTKWFSIVGIIASIVSIVFISLKKGKSWVGKIIFLAIIIAILAIVIILHLITGGQLWQN